MTKLTIEQLALQKQVINTIVDEIIMYHQDIDVIFDRDLYRETDFHEMEVMFTYHSQHAAEHIYNVLRMLRFEKNIYFDSAFYAHESIIEWSLDSSLRAMNEVSHTL